MKNRLLFLNFAIVLSTQVALAQQSKTDPGLEFNPHWFGQIQGGAAYTIGETAFKDLVSPAAALQLSVTDIKLNAENADKGWVDISVSSNYNALSDTDKAKLYSAALVFCTKKGGTAISSPFYDIYFQ